MTNLRNHCRFALLFSLLTALATAQIGTITGPANSLFSCNLNGANTPQLRPEGHTEILGDVLIVCTGGPVYSPGMPVPSVNIVVYPTTSAPITSRIFDTSNGLSETLLLIDEPGSSMPTGALGDYGPKAPLTLCNLPICTVYARTDLSGAYPVATSAPSAGSPNGPNAFLGHVGDFGPYTVVFYNVPVLPPAYAGLTRVFRITNLRISTRNPNLASQVQVAVSASPGPVLPVGGFSTAGIVSGAMSVNVNSSPAGGMSPFSQCAAPVGPALSAKLSFTEGFPTAFKTRSVPLSNTAWASTFPNNGSPGQNIPGGFYNGFGSISESGLIVPDATRTIAGVTYTAGLADYGTRLKAVFSNIPAGLSLYVSASNAAAYPVPGGTSTSPYAVLVATSQSHEGDPDGPAITPYVTGGVPGSDGLTAIPLTPDAQGNAAAIWEVVNVNPNALDQFKFSVYVAYNGLPSLTAQSGAVNGVVLSLAPETGDGTFSSANGTAVPRFVGITPQPSPWVTVAPCAISVGGPALSPFTYSVGGALPASQIATVSVNPSNLAVTATPTVITPASGSWLSASLQGGLLTISANPNGLSGSATPYAAKIVLSAPGVPDLTVPVSLIVYPTASLNVTKSHLGDFTRGQAGATYTILVGNDASAGLTSGIVTVTEQVPTGLSLISMSGSGWDCSKLPACKRSDIVAGGVAYPPITVTVDVAANAPAQVTNRATVSGGGSAGANTSDPTTLIVSPPMLSVAKTHVGSFVQGQNGGVYTVSVSNAMPTALMATPPSINLGPATCLTSQNLQLTSNGRTIPFHLKVQYPDGANPSVGDSNGAWLTATIGVNGSSGGPGYASTTGVNGVSLTVARNGNLSAATAAAVVLITPDDATLQPLKIPVSYLQFASCPGTDVKSGFVTITPGSLSLTAPLGGRQSQSLTFKSLAESPVTFSVSTAGGSWLSAAAVSTTLPANIAFGVAAAVRVTADASKVSSIGTFTGTVTVTENGSSIDIPVTFAVTVNPSAGLPPSVTPAALSYQIKQFGDYSGQEAQTLLISGRPGTQWKATVSSFSLQFESPSFGLGTFTSSPSSLVIDLVSAGQIPVGFYDATITISTPDGTTEVPVTIRVGNDKVLFANPSQAILSSTNGSQPPTKIVQVTGSDNSTPPIAAGTPTVPWLTATTSGNTLNISAAPTDMPTGTYYGAIPVSSAAFVNPINYTVMLVVTADGTNGPVTPDPTSLFFGNVSSQASQIVHVTALNPTNFTVAATGQNCGSRSWLTVTPSGPLTASSTSLPLAVTVNRAGLATGALCSGSIAINTAGGLQTIGVVMEVGTPGPTTGAVTLTESLPPGLSMVSMAGTGWDCSIAPSCTRSDSLPGGLSYPPIAVTTVVATDAASQVTNQVTVSGGGAANATASDPTVIAAGNFDLNGDHTVNIADVQGMVNEALGAAAPMHDFNNDGMVNVADIQKAMNVALGAGLPY